MNRESNEGLSLIKPSTTDRGETKVKRILAVGMLFALTGLSIWAAPQTLTGQVSDSMCGMSHAGMGNMGKNAKECTMGCVKAGGKYVFVSGDKVYDIKNQDFAALVANAGASVQVTGDVAADGKTITVTKIAPVSK
jgi:hypothetical protein